MYIRVKSSKAGNSHRVQIVESVKQDKRTRHIIVQHIGIAHDDCELAAFRKIALVEMENIRNKRNGGLLFSSEDSLIDREELLENEGKYQMSDIIVEKTIIEGPEIVYGRIFDQLGFDELLDDRANDALRKVVIQRTNQAESKLALSDRISEGDEAPLSVDRVYRMMDKLVTQTDKIRELVRKNALRHQGGQIDVVFYDCTTLYFESFKDDDLRKFGFSKDHKHHQTPGCTRSCNHRARASC